VRVLRTHAPSFAGLIDVIRINHFAVAAGQLIVFDQTTWGWVTLAFGIVTALAGLALIGGAEWARRFAIVMFMLLLDQLRWLGSSSYPLWTLAIILLAGMTFYALTVRWGGYGEKVPADPSSGERRFVECGGQKPRRGDGRAPIPG
jgi:hypothetical protein